MASSKGDAAGEVKGDLEDGLLQPLLGSDSARASTHPQQQQSDAQSDTDKKSKGAGLPPVPFLELFSFADKVTVTARIFLHVGG